MKTKIIPFDLETAKKIQAGEIKGKIIDKLGFEGKIITFEEINSPQPVIAKFHLNYGDKIFFVGKDGASDKTKLFLEVHEETQFKPFDKVLVRYTDERLWNANFFSHYCDNELYPYGTVSGGSFAQCIPYEGNEHLVGTTDKP